MWRKSQFRSKEFYMPIIIHLSCMYVFCVHLLLLSNFPSCFVRLQNVNALNIATKLFEPIQIGWFFRWWTWKYSQVSQTSTTKSNIIYPGVSDLQIHLRLSQVIISAKQLQIEYSSALHWQNPKTTDSANNYNPASNYKLHKLLKASKKSLVTELVL